MCPRAGPPQFRYTGILMYWYTRTMARATVPAGPAAAAALPPLPRSTTTSDLVVDSIRRAILDGSLDPGTTLVERRLAEQLGVSKTPVREALIALAASGLVTITPNRGAVVRAVTGEDVRHAYETRLLMEPWAVSRTARRRAADAAAPNPLPAARATSDAVPADPADAVVTDAVVAEATAALDEARRHLTDANHVLLSLANRRFHRALYQPCGNPIVVGHLDALQELAALGAVLLWERLPTWEIEHAEHELILAAVAGGAADRAERLMRRHIRQWVQRLAH
jgi:DNA-binding GntR family transcriptional regulator